MRERIVKTLGFAKLLRKVNQAGLVTELTSTTIILSLGTADKNVSMQSRVQNGLEANNIAIP